MDNKSKIRYLPTFYQVQFAALISALYAILNNFNKCVF